MKHPNPGSTERVVDAARPRPFHFDTHKTALVIIDMQRDFLEPGGFGEALGNHVSHLQSAVAPIRRLLAGFRICGIPVIHTLEGHKADMSDCPPAKWLRAEPGKRIGDPGPMGRILILGEPGNGPIPACAPKDGELVVTKPGKGAFYQTGLEDHLKNQGIRTLILAGVTTEVCVQTTMREANDRGFDVLLVTDGTASYIPAFKQSVLEMAVSQGGILGWTADSDQILFALLREESWQGRVQWSELRPGLTKASLGVEEDGWETAFLTYTPGAKAPRHCHRGREHILMLEGIQTDERGIYRAGTAQENSTGTQHTVFSSQGCLLFISWEAPVEFI